MTKRLCVRLGLAAFITLAVVFLASPYRVCLLGYCRGESTYRGLPTSYWRQQIQEWEFSLAVRTKGVLWYRPAPWWKTRLERWLGAGSLDRLCPSGAATATFSPVFRDRDPSAAAVLSELRGDKDFKVRLAVTQAIRRMSPGHEEAPPLLPGEIREALLEPSFWSGPLP